MTGDTLTLENLQAIYEAMSNIKAIDRSDFFNNYFEEVKERINEVELLEDIIRKQEAKNAKKQQDQTGLLP